MQMHPEYSEYDEFNRQLLEERDKIRVKAFLDILKTRSTYTPDAIKMRLKDNILLFAYDSMKQGGFNNFYTRTCKYLGLGRTASNYLTLKKTNRNDVVAFNIDTKKEKGGFILGEVYVITPNMLFELDESKNNGLTYLRQEKHILLLDQSYEGKDEKKHPYVSCVIYIGNRKIWPYDKMNFEMCTVSNKNNRVYNYNARNYMSDHTYGQGSLLKDDDDGNWFKDIPQNFLM